MANGQNGFIFRKKKTTKRPGVHSKNSSNKRNGYKKPYKGQGK